MQTRMTTSSLKVGPRPASMCQQRQQVQTTADACVLLACRGNRSSHSGRCSTQRQRYAASRACRRT